MSRVTEVVCEYCSIRTLCPRATLMSKICWMPEKEKRDELANQYERAKKINIFNPQKL